MARVQVWLLAPLLAALGAGAASAEHVDHTVTFSQQDLAVSKFGGYDVLELRGCDLSQEIGKPQLPVYLVTLALPEGARPVGIEVTGAESRELMQRFTPLPAQRPRILPVPGMDAPSWRFSEPDDSVYRGGRPYPPSVAGIISEGRLAGNTVVGVEVHPLQYVPESGKIRFFGRIALRLNYEGGTPSKDTARGRDPMSAVASTVVGNPDDMVRSQRRRDARPSRLEPGTYEYVIVTDAGYTASFQPLVDWKTRKGVPATMVTVAWIESEYEGADTQERIRSFISDAAATWGASWFLLGGDTQIIPARRAYAMASEAGMHADEDAIGCDLYYSDLDGDWNLDGDGVYGETEDGVDLYPDVFVGRASVRTNVEVQTFVDKVLSYERNPIPGAGLDMLMAAEVLWNEPFTDSGIALNMIDREHVPPRYDPITKLYETLGNETVAAVTSALNAGQSHFLHSGHAWFTVMGCGEGYLDRNGVDALSNGLRAPVVYSIGCWPAAFDLEDNTCIAEHFMRNPHGGSVAFIGNSRYGWASPGNPGYGYSERFMQEFYGTTFGGGTTRLGAALAAAKARLVPLSRAENVYRWHQYELNLLGDPEMFVWTGEPEQLEVSRPDTVMAGASDFDVSVWTSQGPVEGALVCLDSDSGLYERALTGGDGGAVIGIQVASGDDIHLTVTAPDCRPYEGVVEVNVTGAYVRASEIDVDDSLDGNGDGLPGPGESLRLSVSLGNLGSEAAVDVEATLYSDDPMVQVLSSDAVYGDIAGGAFALPAGEPFTLFVEDSCPNGHVALLDLAITSNGTRTTWARAVALTVAAPLLTVASYSLDDSANGDGDGVPEPGETVTVMTEIRNEGLAVAMSPEASIISHDAFVAVVGSPDLMADIEPGLSGHCVFALDVSPSCPAPRFPTLVVETNTYDGFTFSDTFKLSVGHSGLSDDFEDGAPGWDHGGQNDLWSLCTRRSHSGSTSWYSGSDASWSYLNNMNASLVSPEFVAGPGASVSFWCWYELPTYHEDGFFVELLSGGAPVDTLDFLGSGGALGHLGTIGNEWLEYDYAIGRAAGETLQVRFRFVSDGTDVAEGVYVDDVTVSAGENPVHSDVGGPPEVEETPAVLHQNRPNPFTPYTMIGFATRAEGPIAISIYNIQGRLIRTLLNEVVGPGEHTVQWDGKDEFGADVAAGVYMYRLAFGEFEDTRKMILVR